jgi:hypothetical protein
MDSNYTYKFTVNNFYGNDQYKNVDEIWKKVHYKSNNSLI